MQNHRRYYRRSRIPEAKFCELARYFAQDMSATEAAKLTGVTRKSVTSIFLKLRQRIAEERERTLAVAGDVGCARDSGLEELLPDEVLRKTRRRGNRGEMTARAGSHGGR